MTRWSLLLTLAAAFPATASAQDVPFSSTVRSGEHGEFTRLVFRAPENAQWDSRKSGSTTIVTFGETEFDFDLSQVFQRIDTERLTSVRPTAVGNGLQLNLACDCELDIFQNSLSYVVIDIREGSERVNTFALDSRLLPYRFSRTGSNRMRPTPSLQMRLNCQRSKLNRSNPKMKFLRIWKKI